MATNSANQLRRKQWIYAIVGFAAVVSLLAGGMWLSDPNRKLNNFDKNDAEKQKALLDYTVRSSGIVSAEDAWIEKSEERMKQLESENATLTAELKKMMNMIENGQTPPGLSQPAGITVPDNQKSLEEDITSADQTLNIADGLSICCSNPILLNYHLLHPSIKPILTNYHRLQLLPHL